jgi:hypothetical protein
MVGFLCNIYSLHIQVILEQFSFLQPKHGSGGGALQHPLSAQPEVVIQVGYADSLYGGQLEQGFVQHG